MGKDLEQMINFKGVMERKVYDSDDFKVYGMRVNKNLYPDIKVNKYGNVSICGELIDLDGGVEYTIAAIPKETKYGTSYEVVNISRDELTTPEDIFEFLCGILTINQATEIFTKYPDIIQLVKNGRVKEINVNNLKGIGEKSLDKIVNKIIENFCLADLIIEFKGYLSFTMLKRIYEKYTSVEMLKKKLRENPYKCLCSIASVGFTKADTLLIEMQANDVVEFEYDLKTSEYRCAACVKYLLQQNEEEGNTKANIIQIRKQCIKLVPSCCDKFPSAIQDSDIIYNKDTLMIALRSTYDKEKYIAETIIDNVETDNKWDFDVEKYKKVDGFDLSEEQLGGIKNLCKYNISMLIGAAGCVDCDTEYFNGREWKKISDYTEGERVLQYNEDGTAELVYPYNYIKHKNNQLWFFETKYGLNQCLSDNHNCVYITSRGNIQIIRFKELRERHEKNGFRGKFITSFCYSGRGIDLSDDEIRLMIATFADGSFYKSQMNYSDSTYRQARFHLKKKRKKQRLIEIVNRLGYEYRTTQSAEKGYDDYYVTVPFRYKHFPKEWYNCNEHQLRVIADEVNYWDSDYLKKNRYSTTSKNDADFVQFVFSSLGYRATIAIIDRQNQPYTTNGKTYIRKAIEYVVHHTKRNLIQMCVDNRPNHIKTPITPYITKDGYEYCFTVPSHMLVLRRNNRIFITGNSGKSASTQAIINMLDDNGLSYSIFAPTGKAAKVIKGYTNRPASTVHRGLCYNPKTGWGLNKENKIDTDVVICDEFSMVDVDLFTHLIDAIDFKITRLLLIGDDAQLCSVGCGNLLHNFMEIDCIPTTVLTKVFRYSDGGLMKVATDTRLNRKYLTNDMKRQITTFGNNKDYTYIDLPPEMITNQVIGLYRKLLENGNEVEDIQVLSSQKKGDLGTQKLNEIIQKVANKRYGSPMNITYGDTTYYVDDIVIQNVNNYKAHKCLKNGELRNTPEGKPIEVLIANGETGNIRMIKNNMVVIDFDGELVRYTKENLKMIQLGYCITIHKSQGSSIKTVILITPQSHIYMLNSNLIYTGLTRMKEKCYHFGSVQTVNQAVMKKAHLKRDTNMVELMTKRIEENKNKSETH